MKFLGAIVAYVSMGILLGWGIMLAVRGSCWLLVAGLLAYALVLSRFGCLPAKPYDPASH